MVGAGECVLRLARASEVAWVGSAYPGSSSVLLQRLLHLRSALTLWSLLPGSSRRSPCALRFFETWCGGSFMWFWWPFGFMFFGRAWEAGGGEAAFDSWGHGQSVEAGAVGRVL